MSSSIDHDHYEGPGEADWLTRHRDAYLGELGRLDYAASTIEPHSRAIGLFCEQVTERGLDAGEIDEAVLAELQGAVPTLRSAKGQRGRQGCIARFIAHLIDTGVIAPPTPSAPPAPGSLEHLCVTYGDWLRHQQGLGQTTIKKRQAFLRRFMTFRFGAALGQLNDITPDDILSFLDALPMKTGGSGRGDGATHLRSLFRFLYATRRIRQNLVPLGVPRISAARARGLSRHLPPVEVRKLIDAIHDDDGRGRRNYAMLLMMARLGLRAEEVVAIRLDDINWPASEFLVRGKGGQHDRMPLLPDVGEAIVAYALDGRAGTSRHLFVSRDAVERIVRKYVALASDRCKTLKRKRLSPHCLRHSAAMELLQRGVGSADIALWLGHESVETTRIYLHADLRIKEKAMARTRPVDTPSGRYRPSDALLGFLKGL